MLFKLFQKSKRRGYFLNYSMKNCSDSRMRKDITRKRNNKSISLVNINLKYSAKY
jgi:hypothetical protein